MAQSPGFLEEFSSIIIHPLIARLYVVGGFDGDFLPNMEADAMDFVELGINFCGLFTRYSTLINIGFHVD